ncbi:MULTISPECIES: GNAT family N-acetyltransferase [Clostridium]|uniref:GNAT family N-acetyltransferase n=1 Tax=Clostridium TaxID=1485 RepID=UPI00082477E1|nr:MULTISPECIES: GNAT family N-acetyltransferase [Clostridium]PJI10143.1 N-acetyltransferase [Clostridium sp. CT7]
MITCEKLNDKNLNFFIELNKRRKIFNTLNKDFFDAYNSTSLIKKFFIKKNVRIFRFNKEYAGYAWIEKKNKDIVEINAMYIEKKYGLKAGIYKTILKYFSKGYKFLYKCEKNDYNYPVLKRLGFNVIKGSMRLKIQLENLKPVKKLDDVTIEKFVKLQDENIRCYIQNEIFDSEGRIPLSVEDIYYDETQDYYVDDGAFFIKKCDSIIGYGQYILENNIVTIVNFGIIKKYRGKGYGKYFLTYILNDLKEKGYKDVYIKVDMDNIPAINLYTGIGFVKEVEQLQLEKKE